MSKRTKKYEYRPSGWKLDPNQVTTERVQFWVNGIMASVVSRAHAREAVAEGRAFVISDQAVGSLVDGVAHS